MKNNNHKIIIRLVISNMHNRLKSFFMLLSITLISLMLFSVFSVGFSYYDNYQIMNIRLQGSTANASFINPNNKQLDKLSTLPYINYHGTQVSCGEISSKNLQNNEKIVMTNYSKDEWEKHIYPSISSFKGTFPIKDNDIVMSKWTLQKLKIDHPKIGMQLKLTYTNVKNGERTFTLTGIYDDYLLGTNNLTKSANVASEIFYSQKQGDNHKVYGNSIVSNTFAKTNAIPKSKTVMISLKNKNVDANDVLKDLKKDLAITDEQNLLTFGVAQSSTTGIQFIFTSSLIAVIVLLSGYFLINNILRISVVKDIHYYGQLKTLGATQKQLKKLVKMQVFIYGLFATPIGIIAGAVISLFSIPTIIQAIVKGSSIESVLPTNTSFNYMIFIFTILFVLLTLWISCIKPAKLASKISPVEAMKYTTVGVNVYKTKRKSTHGGKIYRLAFRNVFSDKKKAASVCISLFIGLLSFLTIYTTFANPDFQIRFQKQQPYEFDITVNNTLDTASIISESELEQVRNLESISSVIPVYTSMTSINPDENTLDLDLENKLDFYEKEISYYKEHPKEYQATLIVLNEKQLGSFKKAEKITNINTFADGNSILLLDETSSKNNIGKEVSLLNPKVNKYENFEISNLFSKSENFLSNAEDYYFDETDNVYVFLSQAALQRLDIQPTIKALKIHSNRTNDEQIVQALQNIFYRRDVTIDSQYHTEKTLTPMIDSILFGGMCFALILIIIGILNFVNVIVTSINSRQKELSILEAVGMSKNQLKKLIIYEGLYYVLCSLSLLLSFGVVISKFLVTILHKSLYYFVFEYPICILVSISIILIVVCIITSLILYKIIRNRPIAERLNSSID